MDGLHTANIHQDLDSTLALLQNLIGANITTDGGYADIQLIHR